MGSTQTGCFTSLASRPSPFHSANCFWYQYVQCRYWKQSVLWNGMGLAHETLLYITCTWIVLMKAVVAILKMAWILSLVTQK